MGIVNVNDDSFCGDGSLDIEQTKAHIIEAIEAGADIIDIGAESARTNRNAISVEEELCRLTPVLENWMEWMDAAILRDNEQLRPILSVNTWRSEVVAEVAKYKDVEIINDMGGLPTFENASICAESGKSLLIMHTVAAPKVAQTEKNYDDVLESLMCFFEEKIQQCETVGLSREQLILDPGIDFAKQRDDNLRIFQNFAQYTQMGCVTLLPISRKTVIGDVLGLPNSLDRDAGTWSCLLQGVQQGANIFRVHNVKDAFVVNKLLYSGKLVF